MYTEKQRPKKLKIQTAKSKFYDRKKAELQVFFNPYFASDCVPAMGQSLLTYKKINDFEPGQVTTNSPWTCVLVSELLIS